MRDEVGEKKVSHFEGWNLLKSIFRSNDFALDGGTRNHHQASEYDPGIKSLNFPRSTVVCHERKENIRTKSDAPTCPPTPWHFLCQPPAPSSGSESFQWHLFNARTHTRTHTYTPEHRSESIRKKMTSPSHTIPWKVKKMKRKLRGWSGWSVWNLK